MDAETTNKSRCDSVHFDTELPAPDRPKSQRSRYHIPDNVMQRHNSFTMYKRPHQSRLSVRQSLQKKLSQFFGKHRPHPSLQYYTSFSDSDLSDTSLSDSSLEKLAEAKSVSSANTEDKSADADIFSFVTSIATPNGMASAKTLQPFFKSQKPLDLSQKSGGMAINRTTFEFSDGRSFEWVRPTPRNITEWPDSIKKQIFRRVVVNADKLMICGCQ